MTKDKIKLLENRIKELEGKQFKVPWLELFLFIMFIGLMIMNFQFLTFPSTQAFSSEGLIVIYPWFMNYLFVMGAVISLVAIIEGGFGNLIRDIDKWDYMLSFSKFTLIGMGITLVFGFMFGVELLLLINLSISLYLGVLCGLFFGLLKEYKGGD